MAATQGSTRRTEGASQLLGELADAAGLTKIEVWQRPRGEGSPEIELVQYRWGSGVGWYVQQRLGLDAAQMEGLRAALLAFTPAPAQPARPARLRVQASGNVLQIVFPTEATPD